VVVEKVVFLCQHFIFWVRHLSRICENREQSEGFRGQRTSLKNTGQSSE